MSAAKFVSSTSLEPSDRDAWRAFGYAPVGGQFLYKFYDKANTLLYVGITWNPHQRWSAHARKRPWFDQVRRVDLWECPSDWVARKLETYCIKEHGPLFNIHQNEVRP